MKFISKQKYYSQNWWKLEEKYTEMLRLEHSYNIQKPL